MVANGAQLVLLQQECVSPHTLFPRRYTLHPPFPERRWGEIHFHPQISPPPPPPLSMGENIQVNRFFCRCGVGRESRIEGGWKKEKTQSVLLLLSRAPPNFRSHSLEIGDSLSFSPSTRSLPNIARATYFPSIFSSSIWETVLRNYFWGAGEATYASRGGGEK